jgi:asparagine N-glycosylation enzyme membrane subunit Stt3
MNQSYKVALRGLALAAAGAIFLALVVWAEGLVQKFSRFSRWEILGIVLVSLVFIVAVSGRRFMRAHRRGMAARAGRR